MKHSQRNVFMVTIIFIIFLFFLSVAPAHGQWASTYGGFDYDSVYSIQPTQDGGYIVLGETLSFGAGDYDIWVMKLDSAGVVTWQKTYGGSKRDLAHSIWQTTDGGYIVAGLTGSFGPGDAWILKLDSAGAVTWQKTYGGVDDDSAFSIQQTSDGGYIVAGHTYSRSIFLSDLWVMKLDSTGEVSWKKTYGGKGNDSNPSIQQTLDGGYILAGSTNSFGAGDRDAWILKLDSAGAVTWQKTYGGESSDWAYSIQQTQDEGYVLVGETSSFGAGDSDAWILKLDSAGAVTWQKTYGGSSGEFASSIQQTSDGGYIVAGGTASLGTSTWAVWVLKLDTAGSVDWQKIYTGATGWKYAYSIRQTQDGGYIVAGGNEPSVGVFGGSGDAFILKLDSAGSIGSCPFEGVSTAVVSDTTVTGVNTTVVPVDIAVTGVDTAAIVNNSSASANQWCPLTEDTQMLKIGVTPKKKGEGSIVSWEGLLACPDTCQQEYNKGLTVTLYADPSDLSTFLGWKPASLGCEGTGPCQVTMDKRKSVKGVFQGPNQLKVINIFKKAGRGAVESGDTFIACPGDCEELYKLGTSVTLTATPEENSHFVKWKGRPCKDEPTNVCTFIMDKNITVKAIFEPSP